jgi:hypothetical protein
MKATRLVCLLSFLMLLAGCGENSIEKAAQSGDAQAQFQYALQIEKQRPAEARNYLTLAAGKGVTEAQFALGVAIFEGGMGFSVDKPKGIFWMERAATGGHPLAKPRLAIAYAKGDGCRPNPAMALRWADLDSPQLNPEVAEFIGKALLEGTAIHKDAKKGLSLLDLAGKNGRADALVVAIRHLQAQDPKGNNFQELLTRWKRAAELGNLEAAETWGYYLYYGIGVPANPTEAVKFLEQAAAKNREFAIQTLYWAHNDPKLKGRDPRHAFELLQRLNGRGDGETCYLLSRCYHFGQGVQKDDKKQLELLRQGRDKQNNRCIGTLAWAYQWGTLGLTADADIAISLYKRAARLGNDHCYDSAASMLLDKKDGEQFRSVIREAEKADAPNCHFWLGFHHQYGKDGFELDEARAVELYERSVAKGNTLAKTYLGILLIEGNNVKKDVHRAISLIKEAAIAGNMYAQFSYAYYLNQGTGTAQDSSMAYFWANLAAASNGEEAYVKQRDELSRKIGPEETLRVQALCRDWISSRKKNQAVAENPDLETPSGGTGSGVIYSSEGHVLTNNHVIAGCTQFKVITARGEEFSATLVASDEKLDVAVLKLEQPYRPKGFPTPPRIISSDRVKSGEKVFTIGHPLGDLLGSEPKYNDGTVSAMSGMDDNRNVMQISVPIHPGNSGGPLANTSGDIVGLIVSTFNGGALLREENILAQNINFAIKSEPILDFLDMKGLSPRRGEASADPVEHVKAYAVKIVSSP